MFIYLNKKGQSTLEYAIIIMVVVGALLATQVYIKRGVQGRFKQASDDIGDQFSPQASTYDYTTTSTSRSGEHTTPGTQDESVRTKTITDAKQTQTRTGTEYVGKLSDTGEYWGK